MITNLSLGGQNLTTSQILLTGFQNASFPATVYTRSKRGGYQGNKLVSPSFASYQFVANFTIIGKSFSDLAQQRDTFFGILGTVHSAGQQQLVATRSDGAMRYLNIKAVQVTGDLSSDDATSCKVQVTLEGEYPFIQDLLPISQDVLLTNGGGFAIPFAIPLDMTAGATSSVNITNRGNYQAFPILTFIGLLTNPTLTNNTTGQSITLSTTLTDSSNSAVVDCYNRTVVYQPSGNIGRQDMSGTFWTVPTGISNISLSSTSGGDTGKCTISYANTWLNL